MWRRWGIDAVAATLALAGVIVNGWALALNAVRLPSNPMLYSLLAGMELATGVVMVAVLSRAGTRCREAWVAHQMDVRVVRDGQELTVRLRHLGPQDGQDVWVIIDPPVLFAEDEVRAAMLPPYTTVVWIGAGS